MKIVSSKIMIFNSKNFDTSLNLPNKKLVCRKFKMNFRYYNFFLTTHIKKAADQIIDSKPSHLKDDWVCVSVDGYGVHQTGKRS